MAIDFKPRTFRQWVEDCQPITWLGHGLITLSGGFLIALVSSIWSDAPTLYPISCSYVAGAYILKEIYDFLKHHWKGNLHKRDWQGITPLLDGIMDASAPIALAATTWLPTTPARARCGC